MRSRRRSPAYSDAPTCTGSSYGCARTATPAPLPSNPRISTDVAPTGGDVGRAILTGGRQEYAACVREVLVSIFLQNIGSLADSYTNESLSDPSGDNKVIDLVPMCSCFIHLFYWASDLPMYICDHIMHLVAFRNLYINIIKHHVLESILYASI
jgi:hypothetical protein